MPSPPRCSSSFDRFASGKLDFRDTYILKEERRIIALRKEKKIPPLARAWQTQIYSEIIDAVRVLSIECWHSVQRQNCPFSLIGTQRGWNTSSNRWLVYSQGCKVWAEIGDEMVLINGHLYFMFTQAFIHIKPLYIREVFRVRRCDQTFMISQPHASCWDLRDYLPRRTKKYSDVFGNKAEKKKTVLTTRLE